MDVQFLEDWLVAASLPPSSTAAPPAPGTSLSATPGLVARQIAQIWSQLRTCVQQGVLEPQHAEALLEICQHRRYLHVAEAQAKLLLALISTVKCEDIQALGQARVSVALILTSWVHKTFVIGSSSASQQARETLSLVVASICRSLEDPLVSDHFICEALLLLGTVCTAAQGLEVLRQKCQEVIICELVGRKDLIVKGSLANALAGAGYALTVADALKCSSILQALLSLWTPASSTGEPTLSSALAHPHLSSTLSRSCRGESGNSHPGRVSVEEIHAIHSHAIPSPNMERERNLRNFDGVSPGRETEWPCLRHGLMLFHLMEYQGLAFSSQRHGADATVMVKELLQGAMDVSKPATQCAALFGAAGLRRGLYMEGGTQNNRPSGPLEDKWLSIMRSLEGVVVRVCDCAAAHLEQSRKHIAHGESDHGLVMTFEAADTVSPGLQHKLQCIGLAVGRCRGLPPHPSILQCLLTTLLCDALSLRGVYYAQLMEHQRGIKDVKQPGEPGQGSKLGAALEQMNLHVGGPLFQEVGAIARAMCEQYAFGDGNMQRHAEISIWEYTQDLYRGHRLFSVLSGRPLQEATGHGHESPKSIAGNQSISTQALDEVLVSAFMTVVMFFSRAIGEGHLPGAVSLRAEAAQEMDGLGAEIAARALDSLSCVEFCRHLNMQEYGALVQRAVSSVSVNRSGILVLVRFLPPYSSIVHWPGPSDLNNMVGYEWSRDEVQTSRLSFYLRVLPSCLGKLPELTFANEVAPTMFLFLQHPLKTVARAAHALFTSFLSLSNTDESSYQRHPNLAEESKEGPETTIREQLSVYYIDQSLETFPGTTPFEGLVYGVGAITHHLPPGSPATVYCISRLVDKARTLHSMGSEPGDLTKQNLKKAHKGVDKSGDAQNIQLLLLHLILRVDLKVLPELLKEVAMLVLSLPSPARTTALEDAFDIVAGSTDYVRKPIIVPWVQSLAYLASHPEVQSRLPRAGSSNAPNGSRAVFGGIVSASSSSGGTNRQSNNDRTGGSGRTPGDVVGDGGVTLSPCCGEMYFEERIDPSPPDLGGIVSASSNAGGTNTEDNVNSGHVLGGVVGDANVTRGPSSTEINYHGRRDLLADGWRGWPSLTECDSTNEGHMGRVRMLQSSL